MSDGQVPALRSNLWRYMRSYRVGVQEDAHEFLRALVNAIDLRYRSSSREPLRIGDYCGVSSWGWALEDGLDLDVREGGYGGEGMVPVTQLMRLRSLDHAEIVKDKIGMESLKNLFADDEADVDAVDVYYCSGTGALYLHDGNHRVTAAFLAGRLSLPVNVQIVSLLDSVYESGVVLGRGCRKRITDALLARRQGGKTALYLKLGDFACFNAREEGGDPVCCGSGASGAGATGSNSLSVFQGALCSRLICQCGKVSCRREAFMDLSVEIEVSISSVEMALQNYFACERNIPNFVCNKADGGCGKHSCVSKQLLLGTAPVVLVVHLKLFGAAGKIMKHVVFGATLDLDAGVTLDLAAVSGPVGSSRSLVYSLYAVIVHIGTSRSSGYRAGRLIELTTRWSPAPTPNCHGTRGHG